jgi:hypothetical protein
VTDDLIAKLRHGADPEKNFFPYYTWGEAADALEAKDKRIAELEAKADFCERELLHTLKVKDDRIAALEAALKPFADVAIGMDASGNEFPDEWLLGHNCLLVGDARAARAAMEAK